jgi:hypothetical protein
MTDNKNIAKFSEIKDLNVVELLKNLGVSKHQEPKGQVFLKHLSPLHNPKAIKNAEIVRLLLILSIKNII